MITSAPENSTRAISTICCTPTGSVLTNVRSSSSSPRSRSCWRASRRIRRQSIRPPSRRGGALAKMFSATDSVLNRLSSW
jgi:hypothetical protein